MFLKQINRLWHSTSLRHAVDKSSLSALRKKTGYTFSNCKKALEMHNNDIDQAAKWLGDQAQAMGWSKATKLEGRSTSQGLVGILINQNIGAMVEVNCETDFVARNQNFQQFVKVASAACVEHMAQLESGNDMTKVELSNEILRQLKLDDGKTLGDHLALMIGTVGENATLRRAICYKAPENIQLGGYAHPSPEVEPQKNETLIGKYGTIAAFKNNGSDQEMPKKLCQHIVGMNPLKVGDSENDKPQENKEDETCLIYQEYLIDPEVTVGEILKENNIEVVEYERFVCGGEAVEQENVRVAN